MRVKKIARHLALNEGGKHQGTIADKSQDVAIISDKLFKDSYPLRDALGMIIGIMGPTAVNLYLNGERRARQKSAKKRKSKSKKGVKK